MSAWFGESWEDWSMSAPGAYTIDSIFTLRPGWWPPFSEEAMAKAKVKQDRNST